MRWFKHMTSSADDEKLAQLIDRAGLEGYGFWWRVVEIVARNIDGNGQSSVSYSVQKWAGLLGIRSDKFRRLAVECSILRLFQVNSCGNSFEIDIPNILKFRDEYAKKSGQKPDNVRSKKQIQNKEYNPPTPLSGGECVISLFSLDSAERDGVQGTCLGEENTTDTGSPGGERIDESRPEKRACKAKRKPKGADLPPYTVEFEACWKAYPNPNGKQPAWRAYLELSEAGVLPDDLLERIQNCALEPDWLENAKDPKRVRFIPHMSTWLHANGWEDEGCMPERECRNTPEDERRNQIMAKYNFGMLVPGESTEDVDAKNRRMEIELTAAGL